MLKVYSSVLEQTENYGLDVSKIIDLESYNCSTMSCKENWEHKMIRKI